MVSVRYVNNGEMAVDVGLEIARDCEGMTVLETRRLAEEVRTAAAPAPASPAPPTGPAPASTSTSAPRPSRAGNGSSVPAS